MVERLGSVAVGKAKYCVRWNDKDGNQKYDGGEAITGVFEDINGNGQVDAEDAMVDNVKITTPARAQFQKQYSVSVPTSTAAQPAVTTPSADSGDAVHIQSTKAGVIPDSPVRGFNPFPCEGYMVVEGAECDREDLNVVNSYYEDNQDGGSTRHCVIEAKVGPDDDGMCPDGTLYAEEAAPVASPQAAQPDASSVVKAEKQTKAADPTDRYVAMVRKHPNVTMSVKGKKIKYDGSKYYVNEKEESESGFKDALRGEGGK